MAALGLSLGQLKQQIVRKKTQLLFCLDGWKVGVAPKQSPLTFGVDPNKGMDPGNSFSLSLMVQDRMFSKVLSDFSWNDASLLMRKE